MRLPAPLLDRARRARRVLEVGAGADFATARALQEAAPDAQILVSDVDARVLHALPGLHAILLDVTRPDVAALGKVDLVVAVRIPEELQPACARLARALGADLAMRALKDEWADVGHAPHVVWPDGWRYWARPP